MPFVRSRSLPAALLGAVALLATHLPAQAGEPSLVSSGASPFAKCKIKGQADRVYMHSALAPVVSANPSNPQHLVAGWQQDPWYRGLSNGLVSAVSRDGGRTWQRKAVPGLDKCSGGTGDFAFDRSESSGVAISPDGTSYFVSASVSNPLSTAARTDAVMVSRSSDGGMSWGAPIALMRDTDWRYKSGLVSIASDAHDKRYVYATWTRAYNPNGFPSDAARSSSITVPSYPESPAAAYLRLGSRNAAAGGAKSFLDNPDATAPAFLARTSDGGQTWEQAKMIYDPGKGAGVIGTRAIVLNDGALLVFFTELLANGDIKLRFVKSIDNGDTFSSPADIANVHIFTIDSPLWGVLTPDRAYAIETGLLLFQAAADPATGRLFLTWEDYRQDDVSRVAFTMSSDRGATWSTPVMISKTPANASLVLNESFLPSIAVAADSKVIVTYYDFRNDPPKSKAAELADVWAISCDPKSADCRSPAAWGSETRLTKSSFNMLNAPYNGSGLALGTRQGLLAQGNGARAVFGMTAKTKRGIIVTTPVP